MRTIKTALLIFALIALTPLPAQAVRVKDLASVKGVRGNQLVGYGLVVGLMAPATATSHPSPLKPWLIC